VRYEHLAEQPDVAMRAVLGHVGLDPAAYDFEALGRLPVRGSSAIEGTGDQRWAPHEKPTQFKPVGRWREAWSESQKRRFKAIAGPTLVRAGYADDPHW
jgi:hypothetical protein